MRNKKFSKVIAMILSFALIFNLVSATGVGVSAEGESPDSQIYLYSPYMINYDISGSWGTYQNVSVTIKNIGAEVIENWALKYDFNGNIENIWNAKIVEQDGVKYIKNMGYNSDINPGESVNYGYTLANAGDAPEVITICQQRAVKDNGYTMALNVTGDWGSGFNGEIVISNNSDKPIENWELTLNSNFTIDNCWAADVKNPEIGKYILKGTYNKTIEAYSSVYIGFGGTKTHGEILAISSANATETMEINNETESLTISDDGEVLSSGNEIEVSDIGAEPEISNINTVTEVQNNNVNEVSSVNGDIKISNITLTEIVIGANSVTAPIVDWDNLLDSDEDGIADIYEYEIGSDPLNPDTDSDELPDGYEYYTLGTDPTKSDTDSNGVLDCDEDFDNDGLTNLEEYTLGTDPFSPDTDGDNLSDGDEVHKYGTDPLSPDTDDDAVYDGDEITLGLDPLNPETNGYPDGEHTTQQTISADSDCFAYINVSENNPFTVSMDIKAAGVAKNCLSTGESGYSSQILQNEAVVGVVPGFSYKERLSVEDVVINFHMNNVAADNPSVTPAFMPFSATSATSTDDISKYTVFKLFEDTNMLLPIDTFYDFLNNRIYTHVDELGTYCLIDTEVWFNYLENMESGDYYETEKNPPANIVFCLDTREIIDEESFNVIKNDIRDLSEEILDNYSDVKVYLYYQEFKDDFTVKNNMTQFSGISEIEKGLDGLKTKLIKCDFWSYDLVEASNYVIGNCDENKILMYHITGGERVMGDVDGASELLNMVSPDNRIHVSVICPFEGNEISKDSFAAQIAEKSGGIVYPEVSGIQGVKAMSLNVPIAGQSNTNVKTGSTGTAAKKNITSILGEGADGKSYKVISATSMKTIKLDEKLNYPSGTDTDKDGLYDWTEVDVSFIEKMLNKRGKSINPMSST